MVRVYMNVSSGLNAAGDMSLIRTSLPPSFMFSWNSFTGDAIPTMFLCARKRQPGSSPTRNDTSPSVWASLRSVSMLSSSERVGWLGCTWGVVGLEDVASRKRYLDGLFSMSVLDWVHAVADTNLMTRLPFKR